MNVERGTMGIFRPRILSMNAINELSTNKLIFTKLIAMIDDSIDWICRGKAFDNGLRFSSGTLNSNALPRTIGIWSCRGLLFKPGQRKTKSINFIMMERRRGGSRPQNVGSKPACIENFE